MSISLLVNGVRHGVDVAPGESLLTVLRDNLNLTGNNTNELPNEIAGD